MSIIFENRRKLFVANFTFEAFDVAHFLMLVLVTDRNELLIAVKTFQVAQVKVQGHVFFETKRDGAVAAEVAFLEVVFVHFVVKAESNAVSESGPAVRVTTGLLS